MASKARFNFVLVGLVVAMLCAGSFAQSQKLVGPVVRYPLGFTVSAPMRTMPPQAHVRSEPREMPRHAVPHHGTTGGLVDPVVQSTATGTLTAQSLNNWEGLGNGYANFTIVGVPPDTNLAVGPNHVVQWVNGGFVVFDKTGHQLMAPLDDSTFRGNSTCNQLGGYSDPIVQYDKTADRWLIGEIAIPAFPGLLGQFAQCFAVSTTNDPTGSYNMWAYGFGTNINDYPKISVWPDAYYVTWNIFDSGGNFVGPEACAWDRSAAIKGAASPGLVCFKMGNALASLLPSDWDGSTAPPAGSPNYLMDVDPGTVTLNLWKFHVDFVNTNNSTFTGPTALTGLAAFTSPCLTTQDCLAQPGTTQMLDALGDRLMYRLAYRNFGDHEALVANHSVVSAGGNIGVRWYEVRSPNGTPTIYQQGTYAPDTDNRWMASVAQDQTGNIAMGYSVASGATYPSIRYTGWEVGNALNTLQAETTMVSGAGVQTSYNRWGDYSAMRIDPSDDCTFYYTTEYYAATQAGLWYTRIGSFKFPSCGGAVKTATTTAVASSLNPSTIGANVTFTATVSQAAATGTVTFYDGATALTTVAVSGGSAQYSTSSLARGSHSITAAYSGDPNYSGSTSSVLTQTVNGASTSTTLASSQNPSNVGQSVTFTATVTSGSGIPTSTVTFKDGSTTIGSGTLNGSGMATLTTTLLAAGSHSITAVYGGDANFNGSTSNTVTQTVSKTATSTTLASSATTAKRGTTVTFTATVSPASATGTVGFYDGTKLLSTITLSGGTAKYATSSLAAGTHTITAKYSGDNTYSGSTSNAVTETITRK